MANLISGPSSVKMPPVGGHIKRVVVSYLPAGTQNFFYFDTTKPIFDTIKEFCEAQNIPDHVNYSFKSNDHYVTEKNKSNVQAGQTLELCEAILTVANRLTFDLRKDNISLDCVNQILAFLQHESDENEFAHHFASQFGIKELNQLIATRGMSAITSCAMQCLVNLLSILGPIKYGDPNVVIIICSELQKNRKHIEAGSFTAQYISSSYKLLSIFLSHAGCDEFISAFSENVHFVAATYLEPSYPQDIIMSALIFLNCFLSRRPNEIIHLLNGKPPSCINLRKLLNNMFPVINANRAIAAQAQMLIARVIDREHEDWTQLIYDVSKHLENLESVVKKLNGLDDPCIAYEHIVGYDLLIPAFQDSLTNVSHSMALSALEFVVKNWRESLIGDLKIYNLEHPTPQKIPVGDLAVAVVGHVWASHFSKTDLAIGTIRVAFCSSTEMVDCSSYDLLFAKLIDLAVSTWKLMEGGKTPRERVFSVVFDEIDCVLSKPLVQDDDSILEFDDRLQNTTYSNLKLDWLQQQVYGLDKYRCSIDIGRKLELVFEPYAFQLIKLQRLSALSIGRSFTKIPRTQPPEWPCRYFKLTINGGELRYQDLEESSRGVAPLSLQYSIAGNDIKYVFDGEQLRRPPKGVDLSTCFGMHRVVPKESESESTDRDEKSFFQASDSWTCTQWKDGLKLFIDPKISKDKLSDEFRNEMESIIHLEVLTRLTEITDYAGTVHHIPADFFRPPDGTDAS